MEAMKMTWSLVPQWLIGGRYLWNSHPLTVRPHFFFSHSQVKMCCYTCDTIKLKFYLFLLGIVLCFFCSTGIYSREWLRLPVLQCWVPWCECPSYWEVWQLQRMAKRYLLVSLKRTTLPSIPPDIFGFFLSDHPLSTLFVHLHLAFSNSADPVVKSELSPVESAVVCSWFTTTQPYFISDFNGVIADISVPPYYQQPFFRCCSN